MTWSPGYKVPHHQAPRGVCYASNLPHNNVATQYHLPTILVLMQDFRMRRPGPGQKSSRWWCVARGGFEPVAICKGLCAMYSAI